MGQIGKVNGNTIRKRLRSCKECYARWDKPFAAMVGVLAFSAIIATIIFEIYTASGIEDSPSQQDIFIYKRSSTTNQCTSLGCKVVCKNVLEDHIEEEIRREHSLLAPSCKLTLEFSGLSLTENKIPNKWLSTLGITVKILKIITSPEIVKIDDGAFSSEYLRSLSELSISNTPVHHFRKDMFEGMLVLDYFFLEYYETTPVVIEKDFLYHVVTLTRLQLTYCKLTSDTIRNLTDSVELSKLSLIDFGYSHIDFLEMNVFRRAPQLRSLYLRNTGLKSLELGVFNRLSQLDLIDLGYNSLTTLPDGIFNGISSQTNITLRNNPWHCDCELQWLQDLYSSGEYIHKNNATKCDNYPDVLFEDVDFCPTSNTPEESSSNPSTTTTITSTDPTTTIKSKYRTVDCQDNTETYYPSANRELVKRQTLTILEETFDFEFYETNEASVKIEVDIDTTADLNYYHLLWFNSHHPSKEGCISHLKKNITLYEMQPNNTYTICILYNAQATISPHDCFGFQVRVEYSERAWIKNKARSNVIIIAVCLVLITILISGCLMYCCVRYHPNLIKGNNRVIIIGKQKPKPQQQPQSVVTEYDRPAYVSPSVDSYATGAGSYITTSNGYSRVKEKGKRFTLSSIQEASICNNDMTYVNPRSMSQQELSQWRQSILIPRASLQPFPDESPVYEPIPPPLPPPNQQQKQMAVAAEENSYTTV